MTKIKKLQIGQGQAKCLCGMSTTERFAFIAEGLPIILASAQGFWNASLQLKAMSREAEVLEGLAKEEAAKILILMDAARCPANLASAKMGMIVNRFYSHLERLICAQVAEWWAEDVARLRTSVEPLRKNHYVEGNIGEYILPNPIIYERESKLYADIEVYEDGTPVWNAPTGPSHTFRPMKPPVLAVAEAMSALGLFTPAGLKATSEVWGQLEFTESESLQHAKDLTCQIIKRLITENLPSEATTQAHIDALHRHWPLPMYNVDLSPILVTLKELKLEQDHILWNEVVSR